MKFYTSICKYKRHILAKLQIFRPSGSETKKACWSVKLLFEGKVFKKLRFEELILKDISG